MGITFEQALTAREFYCQDHRGKWLCWRRNGQTKTWKTRPGQSQIPVKYGLYDYGYITHINADKFTTSPEEGK